VKRESKKVREEKIKENVEIHLKKGGGSEGEGC